MRNVMVELLVLLSLKIQVECDKQASQVVDQFVIKRQFKEKVCKALFLKKMWGSETQEFAVRQVDNGQISR